MLPTFPNSAPSKSNLPATKQQVKAGFLCRQEWQIHYPPDNEAEIQKLLDDQILIVNEDETVLLNCNCGGQHQLETILPWMMGTCNAVHNSEYTPELREKMGRNGKNQTGPKTKVGKLICSMNGLKHGATAKKHIFPRAAHGKLDACNDCPFFERCGAEKWILCELQMPNIAAFVNAHKGDGSAAISEIVGDVQAKQAFLLQHALNRAIKNGITVQRKIVKRFGSGEKATEVEETWEEVSPDLLGIQILTRSLGGVGIQDWKLTPQSEKQAEQQVQIMQLIQQISQPYQSPAPA